MYSFQGRPRTLAIVQGNTALKIIGSSSHHSRTEMEKEMRIGVENMEWLRTGQFIVKGRQTPARKVTLPSHYVGTETCIDDEAWFHVSEYQLRRYYQKSITQEQGTILSASMPWVGLTPEQFDTSDTHTNDKSPIDLGSYWPKYTVSPQDYCD